MLDRKTKPHLGKDQMSLKVAQKELLISRSSCGPLNVRLK